MTELPVLPPRKTIHQRHNRTPSTESSSSIGSESHVSRSGLDDISPFAVRSGTVISPPRSRPPATPPIRDRARTLGNVEDNLESNSPSPTIIESPPGFNSNQSTVRVSSSPPVSLAPSSTSTDRKESSTSDSEKKFDNKTIKKKKKSKTVALDPKTSKIMEINDEMKYSSLEFMEFMRLTDKYEGAVRTTSEWEEMFYTLLTQLSRNHSSQTELKESLSTMSELFKFLFTEKQKLLLSPNGKFNGEYIREKMNFEINRQNLRHMENDFRKSYDDLRKDISRLEKRTEQMGQKYKKGASGSLSNFTQSMSDLSEKLFEFDKMKSTWLQKFTIEQKKRVKIFLEVLLLWIKSLKTWMKGTIERCENYERYWNQIVESSSESISDEINEILKIDTTNTVNSGAGDGSKGKEKKIKIPKLDKPSGNIKMPRTARLSKGSRIAGGTLLSGLSGYSGGNVSNSGVRVVRGLFDWDAKENDEISFKAGELLLLTSDDNDDWWYVQLFNKTGLVPSSYVELL